MLNFFCVISLYHIHIIIRLIKYLTDTDLILAQLRAYSSLIFHNLFISLWCWAGFQLILILDNLHGVAHVKAFIFLDLLTNGSSFDIEALEGARTCELGFRFVCCAATSLLHSFCTVFSWLHLLALNCFG